MEATEYLAFLPLLILGLIISLTTASNQSSSIFLGSGIIIFMLSYFLAIPKNYWKLTSIKHMAKIPISMLLTLSALVNIKKAGKKFIHTPHKA